MLQLASILVTESLTNQNVNRLNNNGNNKLYRQYGEAGESIGSFEIYRSSL